MSAFEVVADAERAYEFVRRFFPLGRTADMKGLCQMKDGEPIAAVVYDDFNGSNVFMHCCGAPGRRWLTRHFLHEAFKHPFVTLGCRRITLWVEMTNTDSRRFVEHLGFQLEAVLQAASRNGGNVAIYRMLRDECRYA